MMLFFHNNDMTARLLTIIIALAGTFALSAQQLSEQDRNRYVTQIRAYKHDFLTKELDLTKEQQADFFELYDKMEDRIIDLGTESRTLEKRALENEATPEDVDAAIDVIYNQKIREGEIEKEYFDKFREILNPQQLVQLKSAERRFNQELMRQHRRIRSERKRP